jgi:small nuclear ribonucleoprotein D3
MFAVSGLLPFGFSRVSPSDMALPNSMAAVAPNVNLDSVPVKLLREGLFQVLSVEMSNGEVYTGKLINVDSNLNFELEDAQQVTKAGKTKEFPRVYLRGSGVVFFRLPDMLEKAPCLQKPVKDATAAPNGSKRTGFGARGRGRKMPRTE